MGGREGGCNIAKHIVLHALSNGLQNLRVFATANVAVHRTKISSLFSCLIKQRSPLSRDDQNRGTKHDQKSSPHVDPLNPQSSNPSNHVSWSLSWPPLGRAAQRQEAQQDVHVRKQGCCHVIKD